MIKLTIDGKAVEVAAGATILEAAERVGVRIPTLCFLKKVSPTGACRLCVVEIDGVDKPMTACNTPVADGIVVTTQSEQLAKIRRQTIELLLVNHPLDCPVCDAGGECELQNVCYDHDVVSQPFAAEDVSAATIDHWPLIQQVPNRCVLCEKCVKVCYETVGSGALFINDKGDKAFIDKDLDKCEFCGNCVAVCPTGTMISKTFKFKARPWELKKTPSVCTACSAQCQIDINSRKGQILRITSDDTTVNNGNLCIGGFFSYGYSNSPQRLTAPLLKVQGRQQPVSWDAAFAATVSGLKQVAPAAVAGLASPRLTNEENYLFQKLFRVALGSNNIDSEARFGALRTYRTLRAALNLQGASNRLDRIGVAQAVLVFGCDVTAEAPAVDWQIQQANRKRDAKLVVANMRAVKLDRQANAALAYRPGSGATLAMALTRVILDRGLADQDYLNRFVVNLDELQADLAKVDLDQAAAVTGIARELIEEAAGYLGAADSVALIFGADVSKGREAEATVAALANLALVSGALHGDCGGLFPLDEKGNMQGLLDMGVCPELLPGGHDYTAGAPFAKAWNVPLPAGGCNAGEILAGIESGEIRALYLAATNPLVSFPESARWRKALEKIEFLVVQDILATELTLMADVVLPGATPFEKSGTVTAADQRINVLRKALDPVGEAREDGAILAELYARLSGGVRPEMSTVQLEIKQLSGIYNDTCFVTDAACWKTSFSPADKSLRYTAVAPQTAPTDDLQLLSGKILFHFGTTSTCAPGPNEVAPCGYIEMNAVDADRIGVKDGDAVKVVTTVGETAGPARVSSKVPAGLIFAPYHFADVNIQQVIPADTNLVTVQVTKG